LLQTWDYAPGWYIVAPLALGAMVDRKVLQAEDLLKKQVLRDDNWLWKEWISHSCRDEGAE